MQQSTIGKSDGARVWHQRHPQHGAIESAKQTVLEIIGRPLYDQLRVEATWGYALCGGNTTVMEPSQQFFDKADRGRAGATANAL